MNSEKILVVEDEWIVGDQICRSLRAFGYEDCLLAGSAAEAIRMIETEKPDLVLMDIVLPGDRDGIETAELIRNRFELPVIYLTAHTNAEFIARARETGPYGYLIKPFNKMELYTNIEMALQRHQLEKALKESNLRLDRTLRGVIAALTETIELRGPYLPGHHERVKSLAMAIAAEMGLSAQRVEGIGLVSCIYDIGMINVPMEVLHNVNHLEGIKLSLFRTYPTIGYGILQKIDFPWPIAEVILQHREHYDGTGFPQGIKGENIILEARILAVADALEDLTSHRAHRQGYPPDKALELIKEEAGSRFDPQVVTACLRLFREKGFRMP